MIDPRAQKKKPIPLMNREKYQQAGLSTASSVCSCRIELLNKATHESSKTQAQKKEINPSSQHSENVRNLTYPPQAVCVVCGIEPHECDQPVKTADQVGFGGIEPPGQSSDRRACKKGINPSPTHTKTVSKLTLHTASSE